MNAYCLHHCTHCAAGDNAGSFGCRLNQHSSGAELSDQLMRERVVNQRHTDQVFLGRLDRLFNCQRHFASFARAKANVTTFITDYDECRKRHVLATLYHLGDAIDGDDLVLKIQPLRRNTLLWLSHFFSLLFLRGFSSAASVATASCSGSSAALASSSLFKPAARAASVKAFTRP